MKNPITRRHPALNGRATAGITFGDNPLRGSVQVSLLE